MTTSLTSSATDEEEQEQRSASAARPPFVPPQPHRHGKHCNEWVRDVLPNVVRATTSALQANAASLELYGTCVGAFNQLALELLHIAHPHTAALPVTGERSSGRTSTSAKAQWQAVLSTASPPVAEVCASTPLHSIHLKLAIRSNSSMDQMIVVTVHSLDEHSVVRLFESALSNYKYLRVYQSYFIILV